MNGIKNYYSYNDHIKFGWGQGIYNFEDRYSEPYWIKFGRAQRIPKCFREECVNAAKLIGKSANREILVSYSGGIDSEIILASMKEAKVECSALIMQLIYKGEIINTYDTDYAFDYVKKNKIKYKTFDIDFDDFFKNRVMNKIKYYQSNRPGILIHAEIMENFCKDYFCVFGGGDINLKRLRLHGYPNSEGMFITEEPTSVCGFLAAHDYNTDIASRFFMYTPELMLSWLLNEDIKTFVKYERAFIGISAYGIKPFVIHKLWPDLLPRPKYTGFEKLNLFEESKWNDADPDYVEQMKIIKGLDFSKNFIDFTYDQLLENLMPL